MPYQRVNQPERDLRRSRSGQGLFCRTAIRATNPIEPLPTKASNLPTDLTQVPLMSPTSHQTQQPIQAVASERQQRSTVPLLSPGGGRAMPAPLRTKMERAFNTGFGNVKIHEGSQAQSVNAIAYTQRNDIYFAQGQFQPDTPSGQALIGHELAHVVQQRQGRVKPTSKINGLPLNNNPALEQEADRLGMKAAQS